MATLKSLVDETSNIKNELVECHTNLKNNLISKGVECSDNDKISSLINKVGDIEKIPTVVVGEDIVLAKIGCGSGSTKLTLVNGTNGTSESLITKCNFEGSVKFKGYIQGTTSSSYKGYIDIVHLRGSNTISTKTFDVTGKSSYRTYSAEVGNIFNGDILKVNTRITGNGISCEYLQFTYNLVP